MQTRALGYTYQWKRQTVYFVFHHSLHFRTFVQMECTYKHFRMGIGGYSFKLLLFFKHTWAFILWFTNKYSSCMTSVNWKGVYQHRNSHAVLHNLTQWAGDVETTALTWKPWQILLSMQSQSNQYIHRQLFLPFLRIDLIFIIFSYISLSFSLLPSPFSSSSYFSCFSFLSVSVCLFS